MTSRQIHPMFLEGARGALFAIHYRPPEGRPQRRNILLCPPFAEEMNRCRSMVSLQASRLAAQGIGVLVIDAYGTGDSAGEFEDLTWQSWRDDLQTGLQWLRAQPGGCDTLWGVRTGAIMAGEMATAGDNDANPIRHLLLWQPVLAGKAFFNQFLRIRIAAEMHDPNGIKKGDQLRAMFARGENVEISGYLLGPRLAQEMERLAMPSPEKLAHVAISWFEVAATPDKPLPRGKQRFLEDLMRACPAVDLATVAGPPFWQVHERAEAPALLDATDESLQGWSLP